MTAPSPADRPAGPAEAGSKNPNKPSKPNKPLRVGRLRPGGRGGWQAKLYVPSKGFPRGRLSYKDPVTGAWMRPAVPAGEDPHECFERLESALNQNVILPGAAGDRTLGDLAERYLKWLETGDDDYVRKVSNLLDKWVLRTHSDVAVANWGPELTQSWIQGMRAAGLSASRVEDLGVALAGMRKTAHRKGTDGVRWLDPGEDPLEDVNYSRRTTIEGAHKDYVPPAMRPTEDMVASLRSVIADAPAWPWQLVQYDLGTRCGPRLGEQFALRNIDVDFDAKEILVTHSVRWPRPSDKIEWGLKPTKTDRRRRTPYPLSLHEPLLRLCAESLGLNPDASVAEVAAAQQVKRNAKFDQLDSKTYRIGRPRPLEADEGLLFVAGPSTGVPPTKEAYGEKWRRQRAQSTWVTSIPWRNARHFAATWWRAVIVDETTHAACPWENIAKWLGHSLQTCRDHYVLPGEDAGRQARRFLDQH